MRSFVLFCVYYIFHFFCSVLNSIYCVFFYKHLLCYIYLLVHTDYLLRYSNCDCGSIVDICCVAYDFDFTAGRFQNLLFFLPRKNNSTKANVKDETKEEKKTRSCKYYTIHLII